MAMAMAADILSAKTGFGSSARFSFSQETDPPRPISSGSDSDSSFDFNFCINHEDHRSSSADELFFNGKLRLLPFEMIKPTQLPSSSSTPKSPPTVSTISDHPSSDTQNPTNTWKFRRSFSFPCFSGDNQKTLVSFPSSVQRLFRNKSTGFVPKVKEPPLSTDRDQNLKHRLQKRSVSKSAEYSVPLMGYQKLPLKKRYTGSYSPVINVPSFPLFGFSSKRK